MFKFISCKYCLQYLKIKNNQNNYNSVVGKTKFIKIYSFNVVNSFFYNLKNRFFFVLFGVNSIYLFLHILNCFRVLFNIKLYKKTFFFFQIFFLRVSLRFRFYLFFKFLNLSVQLLIVLRQLKKKRIYTFIDSFLEYSISYHSVKVLHKFFVLHLFKKSIYFSLNEVGLGNSSPWFNKFLLYRRFNLGYLSLSSTINKKKILKPRKHKLLKNYYFKKFKNFLTLRRYNLNIISSLFYNNFFITICDFFGNPIFRLTKAAAKDSFFRKRSPLLIEFLISEMIDYLLLTLGVNKKKYKNAAQKSLVMRLLAIIKLTKNKHSKLNLDYLKFINKLFRQYVFKLTLKFNSNKGRMRSANYYIKHFSRSKELPSRQIPIRLKFFLKKKPFNGCRLKKQRRL